MNSMPPLRLILSHAFRDAEAQLTGNSSSLAPRFLAYSNISGKPEAPPVDSIALRA
jgi:hypothetical protein